MNTQTEILNKDINRKKALKMLYKQYERMGWEKNMVKNKTPNDKTNFRVTKDNKYQTRAYVKDRQLAPDQFMTYIESGFILEKFDLTCMLYHNTNLYINTFNIGSNHFFLQYVAKEINQNFEKRMLPSRTFSSERKLEMKEVILLNPRDSRIFWFNGTEFIEIDWETLLGNLK